MHLSLCSGSLFGVGPLHLSMPGGQASPFSPSRLLAVLASFHNRIQRIQDSFQVSLRFDFRDFLLKRKEERAIVIPDNSIC